MRFDFDEFSLDTDRFELSRAGGPLHLEPQVVELLALLIENSERLVSRDEIIARIWRGRVVSEAALSSRIKSARQALGDDGQSQRYIRTVHGKGFRFLAPVQRNDRAPRAGDAAQLPHGEAGAGRAVPSPAAAHAARPAVVVLPFANLSPDPEQEYLADGITADLIARLSRHRWIDVVARNTSFGYKGRAVDVREVGTALRVGYVVEGSMQRSGKRVRIGVQLVESATGHGKWSERYDRELADIFTLQDEIAEIVAARLEPEIGFAERNRVVQAAPPDLQAWDCFHLGIYHFYRFTGPDNREAQRLLRLAQSLDPQFGETFAWWAYALILGMVYWDTAPSEALLDAALRACDRAVELDRQNATFRALKARVLLARREYDAAIAENRAAIELNPSFAAAHCGLGDSLAYEKRYDESIGCFSRAIALSPNDPQLWAFYSYGALALIFKGDYTTALDWTEQAAAIPNCQYWTRAHRTVALAHLGRIGEACAAAARLQLEMPGFSLRFVREKLFYLREPEQIDCYLRGLQLAGVAAD